MKRVSCPSHVPLGSHCAETILERHAEGLPDLTDLVVLTPNATSVRVLRSELLRHAKRQGHQGLLLPPILPFKAWACQNSQFDGIENHLSELLDLVDVLHQNQTLRTLIQTDSWSVAEEMMELFDQLWLNEASLPTDKEELTSQLREAYRIAGKTPEQLGEEAHIVHLLWTAWNESSRKILSSGKYYREALRNLRVPPNVKAIYACGYDRLALAEIEALRRMSESVPVHVLARPQAAIPLDSESSHVDTPPPPHASVLQEAFALDRADVAERARACREEFPEDPLTGRIFSFVADQAEPHARGIDIQIRRWLNQGYRNIGLVTEDRKLARRVCALLNRASVSVQDHAGWALSTTSAASAIERWIECLDQEFHYLPFLDVLKSPFTRLPGHPEILDQVGEFERALHFHNIHSGLRNYREVASGNSEWISFLDHAEKAAAPLLELSDIPSGSEYMEALLESLELLGCLSCLSRDEAGKKALSELESLRLQLEQNDARLQKSQWRSLLRRAWERENYRGKAPRSAVSLINLNQAHLARFDRLIVAGMDSRHYPGINFHSLVFNDSVRGDLGLPTSADSRKLDLQRFLSLIVSSDQVLLTYQKIDRDEPLLPSVWWTQINVFHRLIYGTSLKEPSLSALSLHPDAQVRPPGPRIRQPYESFPPSPAALPELLPDRISASGHQALIDCPYKFYVRYMLGIREMEMIREEMDNLEFGEYVHRCLEAFHAGVPGVPGPWKDQIEGREDDALETLLNIGDHVMAKLAPNASNIVFMERWRAIARRYVQLQKTVERQQTPVESERTLERKVSENLTIVGRVDRLDQDARGGRIVIDYKTGSKKVLINDVRTGEQVQLPSYALVANPVERVEYWWVGQDSRNGIPLTSLEGEELSYLSEKVDSRLRETFRDLRNKRGMPANGSEAVCGLCSAQGICRKDMV